MTHTITDVEGDKHSVEISRRGHGEIVEILCSYSGDLLAKGEATPNGFDLLTCDPYFEENTIVPEIEAILEQENVR